MNTEISNELNELGEDLQKFDAKCEKAKGNEDLLLDLLLEPGTSNLTERLRRLVSHAKLQKFVTECEKGERYENLPLVPLAKNLAGWLHDFAIHSGVVGEAKTRREQFKDSIFDEIFIPFLRDNDLGDVEDTCETHWLIKSYIGDALGSVIAAFKTPTHFVRYKNGFHLLAWRTIDRIMFGITDD